MEKPSQKTVNLDNTKITSLIHYRSAEMSDATRLLRKEEFLRRKLRGALEVNAGLEREIKSHEAEIKDERSGMGFQLNDLLKELAIKFANFREERLEHEGFRSNETAHLGVQAMMQRYEKIEEESLLLKRIVETLDGIEARYRTHAAEMEGLVISVEVASREYEEAMDESLADANEQIKRRIAENEDLQARTQQLVKEIDGFVQGSAMFREQQGKVCGKIEKLKRMATRQQQKVDEIREWAAVVIDRNDRQAFHRTLAQKNEDLARLRNKNQQLEMYLHELDAEEQTLLRARAARENKENSATSRARSAPKTKRREDRVAFRPH